MSKKVNLYVNAYVRCKATPTGRWKTVVTDDDARIKIECKYYNPFVREDLIDWIDEDRLEIEITEEFINECGSNG